MDRKAKPSFSPGGPIEFRLRTAITWLLTPENMSSATEMTREDALKVVNEFRSNGFMLADAYLLFEQQDDAMALKLLDLDLYGLDAEENMQDPLRIFLAGLCHERLSNPQANVFLNTASFLRLPIAIIRTTLPVTNPLNPIDMIKIQTLAKTNYVPALVRLALHYDLGTDQKEQKQTDQKQTDQKVRFQSWKRAADANNIMACLKVSELLQNGIGVERDDVQAFRYVEKAARFGSLEGRLKTAKCRLDGTGTAKDEKAATVEFTLLSSNRDRSIFIPSRLYLAMCYADGRGFLPKDPELAFRTYKEVDDITRYISKGALATVSGEVLFLISECYASGKGVAKDKKQAVSFMEQSAEKGYQPACMIMSDYYRIEASRTNIPDVKRRLLNKAESFCKKV